VLSLGVEAFIDITEHDNASIMAKVKQITGGFGASAAIVCTASNVAHAKVVEFLRFAGTMDGVGIPGGEARAH
jgi:propanol-preferring alcohol dehydrogenase